MITLFTKVCQNRHIEDLRPGKLGNSAFLKTAMMQPEVRCHSSLLVYIHGASIQSKDNFITCLDG